MHRRTSASRIGTLRALGSRRSFARTGLFAFVAAFLLVGNPVSTLAVEDGEYLMQCSCPVRWEGDWDGNGVFDEDDSLDTIALANGTAVFFIYELPIDAMSLEDYVESRTESLEDNRNIGDVDIVWEDLETADRIDIGRSWVNTEGETMLSWQGVLVWETNYLLSIEFVAAEDAFEDAWSNSLGDIAIVGVPVTMIINTDDVMRNFGL